MTQRLCFISSLLIYLESASLATREQVADTLGLAKKGDAFSKTFHLDLEDYLHGLLQLGSELSRFDSNMFSQFMSTVEGSCARRAILSNDCKIGNEFTAVEGECSWSYTTEVNKKDEFEFFL